MDKKGKEKVVSQEELGILLPFGTRWQAPTDFRGSELDPK